MRAGYDVAGWTEFVAAYAPFSVSRGIPVRPPVRRRLVDMPGERLFFILYTLITVALLAWMIVAAGRAPHVPVWGFAVWQSWVPALVMPVVCALAAFGVGASNPLSFGGRNANTFDPENPGIAGIARHPLPWAIGLWAVAHVVPNGDLAHLILFGGLGALTVAGMAAIDRRKRRLPGPEEWARLAARTSLLPFAALLDRRWQPVKMTVGGKRLAIALLLYVALIAFHPSVIGVSPLPDLQ